MFFKSKKEQQNQDQTALSCLMQNDGPLISMRNIEKFYQNKAGKTSILQKIDLDIEQGDFITIMGPSGAGKSTLLHIMGMLDTDWTGEYHLLGNAVHNLKPKDRNELNKQTVGFVFQSFYLLDSLTVYENLDTPLSYRNIKSSERTAIVCDTLDRFGIVGKKDLFPSQLSGGQQQLVAVARAVISNPKLILADEPTGNLHTKQGEEIMELFTRLNKEGTTIVQVTHSERNATYSKRIINLWDGVIRNEMHPAELEGKE
jgi:putative ABC transport system ATP-binding protein